MCNNNCGCGCYPSCGGSMSNTWWIIIVILIIWLVSDGSFFGGNGCGCGNCGSCGSCGGCGCCD